MPGNGQFERAPVLDPVERITEVIFGLLMAMTFTGTISVATADQAAERTMMLAALGCNLAWGLADAVMYLLRALVERTRRIKLYLALRNGADATAGQALIAQVLPLQFATAAGSEGLELLRRRLLEQPPLPIRAGLGWNDFRGAFGVFLLVVGSTFPLVVPFILLDQTALAIRLSNLIGLVVLFIAGWMLARYAGATQWQGGVIMAATGGVLILAIIALGG
ncbi:VIT1/CCC1 transporter family protein [Pseudomonas sp. PDM28]|uniref:VIT1/CCC1 transporter family protein n=1 Tax=Pseudomonas sp. PDM28 TaxID=2854770 RepID=UPI001C4704B4|nr:VIT1/CCC1 transporter family protein [Pseudomonas sp. PDM28]MBV7556370.1 VIT1/CCC1 transporter family protein [Pseudomonas sp. PDM28]